MPAFARYKRIIICCDGTWQNAYPSDGTTPSNIARIARLIAPMGLDSNGDIVNQVVSYYSGLGSDDLPGQKAISGALGWGLENDIVQIYDFISNNFRAGDELFFFGWSRGAWTVRSAASLVSAVGILSAIDISSFSEMWSAYRARDAKYSFKESSWYKSNKERLRLEDVPVQAVGVFDTVGALGIPQWPWLEWLKRVGINLHQKYEFHDTALPGTKHAFQALALDERRATFPPTLWHKTAESSGSQLQQCWFPGQHQNIGGMQETPEEQTDRSEIGRNALAWMIDNVSGMLTFENDALDALIAENQKAVNQRKGPPGWGCGWIIDNFSGLQGKAFQLLGQATRTPGDYESDGTTIGKTNEFMHPMVRFRKINVPSWKPPALDNYLCRPSPRDQRYEWTHQGRGPVPEYQMLPRNVGVMIEADDGSMSFGTRESLARSLCPPDVLMELGQ